MIVPLILVFLFALAFARTTAGSDPPACVVDCVPRSALVAEQQRSHRRLVGWVHANRRVIGLHRTLLVRPSVTEAINLACTVYGHCAELWRKARCESHLSAYAHNASGASGLFQFLPSTWNSTPYRGFSIWSGYANAMAAGWMHTHGRGGEWVCR